ncbi:unnamed protein product [Effrenium voratum]|nr:unnamed protein product [Effrenium voratum]
MADSSSVRDQLLEVQSLEAFSSSFLATRKDGSCVTWGSVLAGGDSTRVQEQLRDLKSVKATRTSLAALRCDGRVVTWGSPGDGGYSQEVQPWLTEVKDLQATKGAFAALRQDGTVVAWGDENAGANVSRIPMRLEGVRSIHASAFAFAAITVTGNVITWGSAEAGGDSSEVRHQLQNVQHIHATHFAFAAIRSDGRVISWGSADAGGDSSGVAELLQDVHVYHGHMIHFASAKVGITNLTPMSDVSLELSSVCTKRKFASLEDEDAMSALSAMSVGLLYDPALCLESELGLGGVIYYVNNDPEVDDQLYVRWIGTEKPVWKAFLDPILAPPQPYDMISLSPVAGNCQVLWEILEADSISLASLVYVPINPVVPPPLEVKPDYTHFFVWNRRKTKAARRAGIDSDLIQFQTLRRYIAAQCSLQSVVQLLGPLGYELLYLEHIYAVFVHEHVAPLLRQQLGETGPKPSTFEVWRQGWHCSPYSRYMLHLEASFGVDATWLSPDGQGAGEKGLGCLRSFREFLASEGHLISANYTGKGSCAEELETSPESSRQALERRLKAIRASAGASKGLASAQVLAGSSDSNQSMWCWYHLSSNCACLPPYRGSHCDILDQSSDDQVRPFRAAMVYVLLDATQQATQALTERLRKLWLFNGQPGRGYAVLIFHSGLSQETLEQLALASENKIWLLKIPEAVGSVTRPGALRMRWFQSGQVFGHPALRSLDVFWDISADPTEFSAEMQDPLLALHRAALAPAACRRGSARVRLGAELEELTEIYLLHHGKEWKDFLEAGGVKILTGADKADAACTVWRRSFLASDVFTRYIRYLEDTGAFLGAFPDSTAAAVTAVGAAVTAFLDSRSRALLLG